MYYYIREGKPQGEYNASSKARLDVEVILNQLGINCQYVYTKYGVQKKKYLKWKQYITYKKNLKAWMKALEMFNKDDMIFVQYPLLNTTQGFDKFLKKCSNLQIQVVAIIHDLDSLRFTVQNDGKRVVNRVYKEDHTYLPNFSKVICHNNFMKQELIKMGVTESSIINLEIFDYLFESQVNSDRFKLKSPVIVAGNLNPSKVGYLKKINKIKGVRFNLYGLGFDGKEDSNITYKGAYKPEILLEKVQGSFGLVWDGDSINSCKGGYGNYLKFNNPHKASMYIAAGLPLIVWKKSAISSFVEEHNIGITIDSLLQLKDVLQNVSEVEYEQMKRNCTNISRKVINGYYMRNAVLKCIKSHC